MSELNGFNRKKLNRMEEIRELLEEQKKELLSEEKQNEFMQGYCYAIQILLDSMGNKIT